MAAGVDERGVCRKMVFRLPPGGIALAEASFETGLRQAQSLLRMSGKEKHPLILRSG
jgi:hypothetical protein